MLDSVFLEGLSHGIHNEGYECKCASAQMSSSQVSTILDHKESIPFLDRLPSYAGIKDGMPIRFRCMIQDNPDRVFKHKRAADIDLRFRHGLDGIPVDCPLSRDFYDVERFVGVSIPGSQQSSTYDLSSVKCYYDQAPSTLSNAQLSGIPECPESDEPPTMIPACESADRVGDGLSQSVDHHPLPPNMVHAAILEQRVAVLLNICDYEGNFRLQDSVDVIGFIYNYVTGTESLLSAHPKFIIEVAHMEKFVPEYIGDMTQTEMEEGRLLIKSALGRLLSEDSLAAEYLLLQIVSARVHGSETLPTLGSWALNLANAGGIKAESLKKMIQICSDEPVVDFEACNKVLMDQRFYPSRSAESEFTSPGILQLAAGTTVLVDERKLEEGNVNALNVFAINKAVREQELVGIFGDRQFVSFKLDCRFILLNERASSLFGQVNPPNGIVGTSPFVTVAIEPKNPEATGTSLGPFSQNEINLMRRYVAHARSLASKVTISDSVIEKFQNAWVEARKKDSSIPVEDIEIWATLLRTVAASFCLMETTPGVLEEIVRLESERRSRQSPTAAGHFNDVASAVSGA
jgi:hypothetical protein